MNAPANRPHSLAHALHRFRRHRSGSAAIEFALVAPIFFGLLFAIMETALAFFAAEVLESGTQDSARLVFTHQAQDSDMKVKDFKTDLCSRISVLLSCNGSNSSFVVSIKSYSPGTPIPAADLANPIASGQFVNNSTALPDDAVPGNAGDTVLVRAFYQWPIYVTGLGYNIANLSGQTGNARLLAATVAFRVEPR